MKQSSEGYTETTNVSSVSQAIAEATTASVVHADDVTTHVSVGEERLYKPEIHSGIGDSATTESTTVTKGVPHDTLEGQQESNTDPRLRIATTHERASEGHSETASMFSVFKAVAETTSASLVHEHNVTTPVSVGDDLSQQHESNTDISSFATTEPDHIFTVETNDHTHEHPETSNKPNGRLALPLHSSSDGHSGTTSLSVVTEPIRERNPTPHVNEGDLATKMSVEQNLDQHEYRSGLSTFATTEPTLGTSVKPHDYIDEHHDSEPETRNDGSADEGRGRVPDMTVSTVPYVRFSKDKVVYFVPSSPTSLANPRAWEQFAYIPATSPQPQLEGEGSNGNVDLDQGDEGESEGTFSKDRAIEPEETLW